MKIGDQPHGTPISGRFRPNGICIPPWVVRTCHLHLYDVGLDHWGACTTCGFRTYWQPHMGLVQWVVSTSVVYRSLTAGFVSSSSLDKIDWITKWSTGSLLVVYKVLLVYWSTTSTTLVVYYWSLLVYYCTSLHCWSATGLLPVLLL
jgi:hypothetical protein